MTRIKVHRSKCRAKWGRRNRREIQEEVSFEPNGSGNSDYSLLIAILLIVVGLIIFFI